MKNLPIIWILATGICISGCNMQPVNKGQSINALLGDISFMDKFGIAPSAATDGNLRIQTHLEYVEDLLRKKDCSHLSLELQEKRKHLLALLNDYREAGIFPRNYDHSGRRAPCFIDRDGRICAVGYLIEQTAGRETTEQINDKYQYENILAMHDPFVDAWIETSGLTKEECAMIQPMYDYYASNPRFLTNSTILGGVNLSLSTVNTIQLCRNPNPDSKIVPVSGLITGAGSVVYGAFHYMEARNSWYPSEGAKKFSMVNIGLGAGTMILSLCNLKTKSEKRYHWFSYNLYGFPTADGQAGIGLHLSKKL